MTRHPTVYTKAKPAYLTAQAFADHFSVSYMTVNRLMHSGAIKWIRVGQAMRIPVAEPERFKRDAEMAAHESVWGES